MNTVMEEQQAGRTENHWMWSVFARLGLLGQSPKTRQYGMVDLDEAMQYLSEAIFWHVDAMKLRSCAMLFHWASATQHTTIEQGLKGIFDGKADQRTLEMI